MSFPSRENIFIYRYTKHKEIIYIPRNTGLED